MKIFTATAFTLALVTSAAIAVDGPSSTEGFATRPIKTVEQSDPSSLLVPLSARLRTMNNGPSLDGIAPETGASGEALSVEMPQSQPLSIRLRGPANGPSLDGLNLTGAGRAILDLVLPSRDPAACHSDCARRHAARPQA